MLGQEPFNHINTPEIPLVSFFLKWREAIDIGILQTEGYGCEPKFTLKRCLADV